MSDTRTSHDAVATGYADVVRGALAPEPYLRGVLAMFAGRPVVDIGCGPGHVTAHLRERGIEALDPFGKPSAFLFASL